MTSLPLTYILTYYTHIFTYRRLSTTFSPAATPSSIFLSTEVPLPHSHRPLSLYHILTNRRLSTTFSPTADPLLHSHQPKSLFHILNDRRPSSTSTSTAAPFPHSHQPKSLFHILTDRRPSSTFSLTAVSLPHPHRPPPLFHVLTNCRLPTTFLSTAVSLPHSHQLPSPYHVLTDRTFPSAAALFPHSHLLLHVFHIFIYRHTSSISLLVAAHLKLSATHIYLCLLSRILICNMTSTSSSLPQVNLFNSEARESFQIMLEGRKDQACERVTTFEKHKYIDWLTELRPERLNTAASKNRAWIKACFSYSERKL